MPTCKPDEMNLDNFKVRFPDPCGFELKHKTQEEIFNDIDRKVFGGGIPKGRHMHMYGYGNPDATVIMTFKPSFKRRYKRLEQN